MALEVNKTPLDGPRRVRGPNQCTTWPKGTHPWVTRTQRRTEGFVNNVLTITRGVRILATSRVYSMTRAESHRTGKVGSQIRRRLYPAGAGGQRGSNGNNAQVKTNGPGSTCTQGLRHLWCEGRSGRVLRAGLSFF